MSRTTAARRIALLASSSLGLAAIASAASLGVALTPTAAAAQVTCVSTPPPEDNGTLDVTYPAGTYNPDITCVYSSDGALVSTAGAITVSTEAPGGGINLTATGANDVNWDSTAGRVTGGAQTNGPVIHAQTAAGNINLNLATVGFSAVDGSAATVTHGVLAQSSAGGSIAITTAGSVWATNSTSGVAAIEARSLGGNGSVSITTTAGDNQAIDGRLYGILAQASGTGAVTITHSGTVRADLHDPNAIAMDITAGTGLVTVNSIPGLNANIGSPGFSSPFVGTALRASYSGDADFNLVNVYGGPSISLSHYLIELNTAAGTTTEMNVTGTIGTQFGVGLNNRLLRLQGGGILDLNVSGQLRGWVNLAGAGSADILLDGGEWHAYGTSTLSSGADSLTIGQGGLFFPHISGALSTNVLNFGGGNDTLRNFGALSLGSRDAKMDLTLAGLETFENSAEIDAGDGFADDILSLPGTSFVGLDGSTIWLDANLNGTQASCDTGLRDANNNLAADCLRIENGSTTGVTSLVVNELVPGDRGGFNRITLVDVPGGESHAGDFILDARSTNYNAANGGVIDKGFFIYPLVYDPDAQQHVLIGTPGGDAQQVVLLAQSAHDLWRLSAGSWLERQADLRQTFDSGVGGGVWLRVAGEAADRDAVQTVDVLSSTLSFDNSHSQTSYVVNGGIDLLSGADGDRAYVIGLTAGYANSEVEFDASPNQAQFDGFTGGGYASFLMGGLFFDATVHANRLIMKSDVPALGLLPDGTIIKTNLVSVGGQFETGYRIPLMSTAFVEPLAGVSYVRTKYDDMDIASDDPGRPGVIVEFDDPTSLRAGLGARFGLDQDYQGLRAQYSFLARYWNEFEDEARVIGHGPDSSAEILGDLSGQFAEFGVGASVYGLGGALSGFVSFGGKFGDDYNSRDASAGVRVNW